MTRGCPCGAATVRRRLTAADAELAAGGRTRRGSEHPAVGRIGRICRTCSAALPARARQLTSSAPGRDRPYRRIPSMRKLRLVAIAAMAAAVLLAALASAPAGASTADRPGVRDQPGAGRPWPGGCASPGASTHSSASWANFLHAQGLVRATPPCARRVVRRRTVIEMHSGGSFPRRPHRSELAELGRASRDPAVSQLPRRRGGQVDRPVRRPPLDDLGGALRAEPRLRDVQPFGVLVVTRRLRCANYRRRRK